MHVYRCLQVIWLRYCNADTGWYMYCLIVQKWQSTLPAQRGAWSRESHATTLWTSVSFKKKNLHCICIDSLDIRHSRALQTVRGYTLRSLAMVTVNQLTPKGRQLMNTFPQFYQAVHPNSLNVIAPAVCHQISIPHRTCMPCTCQPASAFIRNHSLQSHQTQYAAGCIGEYVYVMVCLRGL